MKAEDAAVHISAKRGHVVIGFPLPGEIPSGTALSKFCGGPLVRHRLIVTGPSSRADWDEQIVAIMVQFGAPATSRKPGPLPGQQFFRCRLEALNGGA